MNQKLKIDVSTMAVVKLTLIIFAIYLLYLIRDVIVVLFVVLILVASLRPVVKSWGKKIGNTFAVIALMLIMFGMIAAFLYVIVPPFIDQTKSLINNLPGYANRLSILRDRVPSLDNAYTSILSSIGDVGGGFISVTTGVFGGIVTFLTIIVLTVYFLLDEKFFANTFYRMIPSDKRETIIEIISKITQKVGDWLRGQLLLGLIIGLCVYVGTSIIGLRYALTLGVIAGVLEIIPIIGPIISGVLGTLIALFISPVTALITAIFYIVLQQLENNLLVPKIMQRAVGLPPAIIIVAILIGGKLLGIAGALLAVPISGILYVIIQEWDIIKKIYK